MVGRERKGRGRGGSREEKKKKKRRGSERKEQKILKSEFGFKNMVFIIWLYNEFHYMVNFDF